MASPRKWMSCLLQLIVTKWISLRNYFLYKVKFALQSNKILGFIANGPVKFLDFIFMNESYVRLIESSVIGCNLYGASSASVSMMHPFW